jgi:hypothetical protein
MGEHKILKPENPRPNEEIMRLKGAVAASRTTEMDPDTAQFIGDLGAAMGWIDQLERVSNVN